MASVNTHSNDAGVGHTFTARSLGFTKIGTDDGGEFSSAASSSGHDVIMKVESDSGGDNAVKKRVWSKRANDVVEVVDAACWPALGESSKPAPKSESFRTALQPLQEPANSSNSVNNHNHNHHNQQSSYGRNNGGPHPRTGGRGKPNQGRGYQEWKNQHRRSFNNNMPPQRPPAFAHPPPVPLQVRPFGYNVMYPAVVAPGMIYYPGPPPPIFPGPFYFPIQDPLHDKIIKQIDFYFSNDNLVKDTYLRRFMDEQGWVPANLIAGFNKVSCLTDNVQLILDVMQKSAVVEVQGDKMRRRNDWVRWLIPPSVQDSLGSQLQGIRLDERPRLLK